MTELHAVNQELYNSTSTTNALESMVVEVELTINRRTS